MRLATDTAARRSLNPMVLEGLWTYYREICRRIGPASISARIARKSIRDYTRKGLLT